MARAEKPKELFTASEVARFCQVDLKTIHNWAERGEFQHFRTPGRHLRFRRADVLDFLRRYGYPIPDVLLAGKPRILVVGSAGAADVEGAAEGPALGLDDAFTVHAIADPLEALVATGAEPPDAVVLRWRGGTPDPAAWVRAVAGRGETRHVRTVVVGDDPADEAAFLEAGASAFVPRGEPSRLQVTLEALLGLDR